MPVPRIIWSYWESDSEFLPSIIQFCAESWVRNSGFSEIRILTPRTLSGWLESSDLPRTFWEMPPVKRANAVRLALLKEHGGVWMDAGVAVSAPIDDFVNQVTRLSGFFAFQGIASDRILTTWFLASNRGNAFVAEWSRRYNEFFARPRIHEAHSPAKSPSWLATHALYSLKNSVLGGSSYRTAFWALWPVSALPFYPYFIMHYIAGAMVRRQIYKAMFEKMEFVGASNSLKIRSLFDKRQINENVLREIAVLACVHKLDGYRSYSAEDLRVLRRVFFGDAQ